ncbi:cysteine proteinase [Hesseltinella vesiculosa]|uniref:Cysteine proteinase n=1 Tax=Hesseltinella vesiculosa TaxID=101127 RepID=A0A1X2GY16_9FUNG|nr:cysteine proteinase [Hesseltinella vesiculosa]
MSRSKKPERATRRQRRAQQKQKFFYQDDTQDLDNQLHRLGLGTKSIAGDGNCLFRSLSDQLHGDDGHHRTVRQDVCQFLRDNKETYQYFVEDDGDFDDHVTNMEADSCFGGNMELAAFAKLKRVKIKVYQPGMIYVIDGTAELDNDEGQDSMDDDAEIPVLHIAYHSWEHYSSVRNLDGPMTGMPEIKEKSLDEEEDPQPSTETSKEKMILNSCPGANMVKVRRLLRKYKGDVDKVIDALYEQEVTKTTDDNCSVDQDTKPDDEPKDHQVPASKPDDTDTLPIDDSEQDKRESHGTATEKIPSAAENSTFLPHDPPKAAPKPKKRMSKQQKKEQARQRRKEQRLDRKREQASLQATTSDATADDLTSNMKQLYI